MSKKKITKESISKMLEDYEMKQHDYNSSAQDCIDLMNAVFNWCAEVGGLTGFQAQCIAWPVVQRAFGLKDDEPSMILSGDMFVYPQYANKTSEFREKNKEWIFKQAKKNLKKNSKYAAQEAIDFWKELQEEEKKEKKV